VKPLIITLDDGHRLNYQLKSVLQGHRVPCVMFLCSGVTGTRRHFWFDTAMPAQDRELLKRLPDCERLARLDAMGFREEHEWADRTALTWEEVADLRGVADFQSHTVLHPVLPHCSDARSLDEIERSRTELERQLKSPVYAIAYPNGSYSERELAFVRRAGYECGLTLDFGLNGRDTSVFQLRRICMRDQGGSSEVIVRASGLWDALKQWFRSSPRLFAAGQRD
jgi:peptidoglycan/xylan/chitin deacetylase (PgdA/CDA1 family)